MHTRGKAGCQACADASSTVHDLRTRTTLRTRTALPRAPTLERRARMHTRGKAGCQTGADAGDAW